MAGAIEPLPFVQVAVTHALSTAASTKAREPGTGGGEPAVDAFDIVLCTEVMRKQGAGYWTVVTRSGHRLFAREGEGETTSERDFKAAVQSKLEAAGCRQVGSAEQRAAGMPRNLTGDACVACSHTCTTPPVLQLVTLQQTQLLFTTSL